MGRVFFFFSSLQLEEDTNPWGSRRFWSCSHSHSPFSGQLSVGKFLTGMWQSKFNSAAGQLFTAALVNSSPERGKSRALCQVVPQQRAKQAICISQSYCLRLVSPQQLNWAWAAPKHQKWMPKPQIRALLRPFRQQVPSLLSSSSTVMFCLIFLLSFFRDQMHISNQIKSLKSPDENQSEALQRMGPVGVKCQWGLSTFPGNQPGKEPGQGDGCSSPPPELSPSKIQTKSISWPSQSPLNANMVSIKHSESTPGCSLSWRRLDLNY